MKKKEINFKNYLLRKEQELNEYIALPLVEAECFISWQGVSLISPATLLTIQGKSGAHKSRLAQEFAIVLLDQNEDSVGSKLGMINITEKPMKVAYIDTERNSNFEFPFALKSIADSAGLTIPDSRLRYTTLRDIDRLNRKDAAEQFIELVRDGYEGELCVIVDVATDLSLDFNNNSNTGELMDLFKKWMNIYNCAIIIVIHENPGSNKMRGHLGTEAYNKATDSISIRKNKAEKSIEIQFEKIRFDSDQEVIEAVYNETSRRLELRAQIFKVDIRAKFEKIIFDLFKENPRQSRKKILRICTGLLGRSPDSIDNYLSETKTLQNDGIEYNLNKFKEGKEIIFQIEPISKAIN